MINHYKNMQYAPIIIFAFNRPKALRNVVCSLLQNTEARESDLDVYKRQFQGFILVKALFVVQDV